MIADHDMHQFLPLPQCIKVIEMKKAAAVFFSLWLLSPFASANTFTTDLTDLWWNANESGWGVTATHQREVVFLTFSYTAQTIALPFIRDKQVIPAKLHQER